MKLKDTFLRAVKPEAKAKKYADGEGLYLLVKPNGAMLWRYDFRLKDGARKTASFGKYPDVSLAQARKKHTDARKLVSAGGDPSAAKKEAREKAVAERDASRPFREVAAEWLKIRVPEEKRAPKTVARDKRMVRYLNADIGDIPIRDLELPHLVAILVQYENAGKYSTRAKVQATAISVMGFAHGRGYIKVNPFLGVNYAEAFTAPDHRPRPAVTEPVAFGHLLRKMAYFEGHDGNLTGIALELEALTFVRPGDVAKAEWAHFNLSSDPLEAKWKIPPDQLKMRTVRKKRGSDRANKHHVVPLARQAVALLRELRKLTGYSRYLFPGRQSARTMSENTMNNALKAIGYEAVHCAHGFRSSASTMLNEERMIVEGKKVLRWPDQKALIEVQLDHDDASTRAIYDRGGRWEERVELMQLWADRIDEMRAAYKTAATRMLVAAE